MKKFIIQDYDFYKYTPVEEVLDVSEPRSWYYIENYNGYEMSNDGYLRSMKHFRKYPYGILITPIKGSSSEDPLYELSDNNNKRVRIKRSELYNIAMHPVRAVSGYPRPTLCTDRFSRNDRHFVKRDNISSKIVIDNTPRPASFTILSDEDGTVIKHGWS